MKSEYLFIIHLKLKDSMNYIWPVRQKEMTHSFVRIFFFLYFIILAVIVIFFLLLLLLLLRY